MHPMCLRWPTAPTTTSGASATNAPIRPCMRPSGPRPATRTLRETCDEHPRCPLRRRLDPPPSAPGAGVVVRAAARTAVDEMAGDARLPHHPRAADGLPLGGAIGGEAGRA